MLYLIFTGQTAWGVGLLVWSALVVGNIQLEGTVRLVTGHPSNGQQEGEVMAGKAEDRNFGKADDLASNGGIGAR